MKGWDTHDISSHRLEDVEFAEWCKNCPLPNGDYVDPGSDDAVEAYYWSGMFYHCVFVFPIF